jgi:hypothetical protein
MAPGAVAPGLRRLLLASVLLLGAPSTAHESDTRPPPSPPPLVRPPPPPPRPQVPPPPPPPTTTTTTTPPQTQNPRPQTTPPQEAGRVLRAPDESKLWLQNECVEVDGCVPADPADTAPCSLECDEHDYCSTDGALASYGVTSGDDFCGALFEGTWATSAAMVTELNRRKNPSFTGANDPFGDHGYQGTCYEDSACLKDCAKNGENGDECNVIARGCRGCLLTKYDAGKGAFIWHHRTYVSTLNDHWAQPCFTCGEWQGPMADPERVIMDAPAVYGVATVAIGSKHWTPLAADATSDEGRRFVSALRTAMATWVQSVASDPARGFPFDAFEVPADTVMVEYVHSKEQSTITCAGSSACVSTELQRDSGTQFVVVQWWIVVGGGYRYSQMQENVPTVIQVGCGDTTFLEFGISNPPPVMVDFDTEEYGNLGFKLLNCLADPAAGATGTAVKQLGSVIGEFYDEPSDDPDWALRIFLLLLTIVLCGCGKKRHNEHMATWRDLQDGAAAHTSDPLAHAYMQEDLDTLKKIVRGEKRQAAKYEDDASPHATNQRLFACFDALSELLQQLIDEGSGQTSRKEIRRACRDRIDPELLTGVLSLVERYNIERPRARSQRRLEESIHGSPTEGLQESLIYGGTTQESEADLPPEPRTRQSRRASSSEEDEESSSEEESSEEDQDDEGDDDDIDETVDADERALRIELGKLRLKELRARAKQARVAEDELEDATDNDDPKSAVTELLVRQHRHTLQDVEIGGVDTSTTGNPLSADGLRATQ